MSFQNAYTPGDAVAITPGDTTQVDLYGLYCGGTGDIAVITDGGTTTTFKAVPTGMIISLRVVTVKSTGTTATNLGGFKR